MKKRTLSMALIVLISVLLLVSCTNSVSQSGIEPSTTPEISAFIDVEQFSRIKEEQLIEILGEPDEQEDWKHSVNATTSYNITTYSYYDNDVYYEYHFAANRAGEKPLGAMTITFNYQGEGSTLETGLNTDIFARLGIDASNSVKKEADTGVAIRWTNVSAAVYEVHALSNNDKKQVDWVKIRFDPGFPL